MSQTSRSSELLEDQMQQTPEMRKVWLATHPSQLKFGPETKGQGWTKR